MTLYSSVGSGLWFCIFITSPVSWIVLIDGWTSSFIGTFSYLFIHSYIILAFSLVIEFGRREEIIIE